MAILRSRSISVAMVAASIAIYITVQFWEGAQMVRLSLQDGRVMMANETLQSGQVANFNENRSTELTIEGSLEPINTSAMTTEASRVSSEPTTEPSGVSPEPAMPRESSSPSKPEELSVPSSTSYQAQPSPTTPEPKDSLEEVSEDEPAKNITVSSPTQDNPSQTAPEPSGEKEPGPEQAKTPNPKQEIPSPSVSKPSIESEQVKNDTISTPKQASPDPKVPTPSESPLEPDEYVMTDLPLPTSTDPSKVIYSLSRNDRSGEMIRDMINCHAYAFKHNLTYGGACPMRRINHDDAYLEKGVKNTRDLIHGMGLSEVLPFRCPPGIDTRRSVPQNARVPQTSLIKEFPAYLGVTESKAYSNSQESLSPEYRHHLQSFVKRPRPSQNIPFTIVAHVRRGDISPCNRKFGWRYMPNIYYIQAIEKLKAELPKSTAVRVIIYSERSPRPFEPFEEFQKRGYQLKLNTPLVEVWRGIVDADVTILSRSSFSHVPAVLADPKRTKVVYFPYRMKPMADWTVATDEEQKMVVNEQKRLQATCDKMK